MAPQEDAPAGLFRALYSVAAWSGLALMAVILVWLFWLLFSLTPSGTAQSQALETVRPTQTALAMAFAGEDGNGGVMVVELPATCAACHAIAGTSAAGAVCPDLTDIATVSAERIASPDYAGEADTVADYIRESILAPNAYVVEGPGWVTPGGDSTMPAAVGQALAPAELERLVQYLASLE